MRALREKIINGEWAVYITWFCLGVICMILAYISYPLGLTEYIPQEELQEEIIELKEWHKNSYRGQRLLFTDVNGTEYMIQSFCYNIFRRKLWDKTVQEGDQLYVLYQDNKRTRAVYSLRDEKYTYLYYDEVIEADRKLVMGNIYATYFLAAIGILMCVPLLIKWIVTPKKTKTAETSPTEGVLRAPVSGKILRIETILGDAVKRGDTVLIMGAMQMQIPVVANMEGRVSCIYVHVGDVIEKDMPVVLLQTDEMV